MPERLCVHLLCILRQVLYRKNEKRMFKPEIINLIETCITDRAECDPGHSGTEGCVQLLDLHGYCRILRQIAAGCCAQ